MTAALIGNEFVVQVGDGGSPEAFTNLCAVTDPGDIGEEKPLVDISTLCSDAREYRPGLADGVEIPLVANFGPGDAQLRALYADFKNNTIRSFQLKSTDQAVGQTDTFLFAAIIRGYKLHIGVGDRTTITYTLKITGPLTWTQS